MTTTPDAAERRLQRALRDRVLGLNRPAPVPDAVEEELPANDWWGRLYDDTHTDHHPATDTEGEEQEDADKPAVPRRAKPRPANRRQWAPVPNDQEQDQEQGEDAAPGGPARSGRRPARLNPRGRRILSSGAAGILGYWGLPLRGPLLTVLSTADHAPAGTLALQLTLGAAAGAVWLVRLAAARKWMVLPVPYVTMPAVTVAAAYAGNGAARGVIRALAERGLPLTPVVLVLTAGALLGGLWALDRRTRTWWPPLAWACRIPLASAVIAVSLYGTH